MIRTYLHLCCGEVLGEMSNHDCIYFLRLGDGMVPLPNSLEEANEIMPSVLEVGLLNAHTLVMLEQVITQVYMPLLSYNQQKTAQKSDKSSPQSTPPQAPSREVTEVCANFIFVLSCIDIFTSLIQTSRCSNQLQTQDISPLRNRIEHHN